ncbi:MAG: ABC transporter ATP-binding protein [Mycobacteriales bacterium]
MQARGLHRFYRRGDEEVPALRDVTFTAAPGEMIAVVGPSGSGKSTLLNLLAGLDDPDGGSVWIDGQRLSHRAPAEQARMRGKLVGVLTQGSGLIEHLSVLGNVRLAASFRGCGRGRRTPAVTSNVRAPAALLSALGIADRAHARPSSLSGGETARAGLAVALAGAPRVLLADEPTAEVSTDEEDSILDLLRQVRPADGTTVLVTHSESVAAAADRVLQMQDGRLR